MEYAITFIIGLLVIAAILSVVALVMVVELIWDGLLGVLTTILAWTFFIFWVGGVVRSLM